MEIEENINLNTLKDDFLYMILVNLQVEDIIALMQVCKRINSFVKQQDFWKIYFIYSKSPYQIYMNKSSSLEMINFLISLNYLRKNFQREIPLEGVFSTSQDNSQSIVETLNDDRQVFWSSTGTDNSNDRDEELIFCVKDGLALVDKFFIQFFYAFYLQTKMYPSERVLFQSGLSNNNLTYSEEFICNIQYSQGQKNYIISHQLKIPQIARVIKLTFKGRIGIQETDNKYYFAVQRIKLLGVPILKINSDKQKNEIEKYVNQIIKQEVSGNQNEQNENQNDSDEFQDFSSEDQSESSDNQEEQIIEEQKTQNENQIGQQEIQKTKKEKYSLQICKFTQKIVDLIQKNNMIDEDLFDKENFQLKQAQQFIQTQNLDLFYQHPELRVNIYAYLHLIKSQELMQRYLQSCVINTPQLSVFEGITVIMQKIDFQFLAKGLICFLELFEQYNQKDSEKEREKVLQQFVQLIFSVFSQKQLCYETDLAKIDYFTESLQHFDLFILQFAEYIDFSQETLELIRKNININLQGDFFQDTYQHSIFKTHQLKIIFQKVIPLCYYLALKTIIDQPERNVLLKQNLFNTVSESMQSVNNNPMLSQPITEENVSNSNRVKLIMENYSISSTQDMLVKYQEMQYQVNQFKESRDFNQFQINPSLCENILAFEILMNSSDLMQQYFEQCISYRDQLSDIESISFFIQKIDYKIIVKFYDILLDMFQKNQVYQAAELKVYLINKQQDLFKQQLKLKVLPYEQKMEDLKFTISCLHFYYIIKPIQNFIRITEQEVEDISLLIQKNICQVQKQEKEQVSYLEYKVFIENILLPKSISLINDYLLSKYQNGQRPLLMNL